MISKRPTLATGHSIAGLSPTLGVIHSDARCEMHLLAASKQSETVLVLVRPASGKRPDLSRLVDWWRLQPAEVFNVIRVLDPGEDGGEGICAVVEIRGRHVEGENFINASEGSLRQLLLSMIDLVERSAPVKMAPDFEPSLTWVALESARMCSLLPLDGQAPAEEDQVRGLARAFYRSTAGILVDAVAAPAPLSGWLKFIGKDLSRVIERCLAPAGQRSRIMTLAAVNEGLGRTSGTRGPVPPSGASSEGVAVAVSAAGQGLDKVAGMHALKELLRRDVVTPIRNPEPHKKYGLAIPNGILLYGPPGCGKTYIARQLAEELGHYFVEIIPSEVASPYVHQTVMRIRDVFDTAAAQAPAVLFVDEFEALVPPRGQLGGHQQHKAEEVNEFLSQLNGCAARRIFVIAATNQPEKIDPAVRRTGRLDKLIYVGPPDLEARAEMLALHLEGRPVAGNVDLNALARSLEGYSASDIRFLVDEAARDALLKNLDIGIESFRAARVKVPPSVPPEIEEEYRSIEQRGV